MQVPGPVGVDKLREAPDLVLRSFDDQPAAAEKVVEMGVLHALLDLPPQFPDLLRQLFEQLHLVGRQLHALDMVVVGHKADPDGPRRG